MCGNQRDRGVQLNVMARPVDRPLARAQDHLRAGRIPNAIGAFRAVLSIDPDEVDAHLGLAAALNARGDATGAADGLCAVAERLAEQDRDTDAMRLYGNALTIDPTRHEVHLDVAVLEWGLGRTDAATARAESLAEVYMRQGRTEEAVEVLRFFASLTDDDDDNDVAALDLEEIETIEPTPSPLASTETVVSATVLIRPDGSLYVAPRTAGPTSTEAKHAAAAPEPEGEMITQVNRRPSQPSRVQISMPPVVAAPQPHKPSALRQPPPSQVRTLPPKPRASRDAAGKLRLPRSPRPAARPSSVATLPPQPTTTTTKPAARRVPPPPVRTSRPSPAVPQHTQKAATEQIRSRPITKASRVSVQRNQGVAPVAAPNKRPPVRRASVPPASAASSARPTRVPPTSSRPIAAVRSQARRSSKSETAPITVRGQALGTARSPLAQRLLSRAHSQRPAAARGVPRASETAPTPPLRVTAAPAPSEPTPLAEDEITRCFRRSELQPSAPAQ